jgi:hypothetical protein
MGLEASTPGLQVRVSSLGSENPDNLFAVVRETIVQTPPSGKAKTAKTPLKLRGVQVSRTLGEVSVLKSKVS